MSDPQIYFVEKPTDRSLVNASIKRDNGSLAGIVPKELAPIVASYAEIKRVVEFEQEAGKEHIFTAMVDSMISAIRANERRLTW